LLEPPTPSRPPVSVVVATHERRELLADCLSLIAAELNERDELIVVESGDATGSLKMDASCALIWLSSRDKGKSAKQNTGILTARNDVVLLTDDDCRVPSGWVEGMARPFANSAVGVAFGPVRGLSSPPGGDTPLRLRPGPAPTELWNYAHGASMAVRRSAGLDVGGFDNRLGPGAPGAGGGEDHDLVRRLTERGWVCEIADAPTVRHLDWRDERQTARNLLAYQRGGGMYVGAALRRNPVSGAKLLALRLLHERGLWRDRKTRGWRFGCHMTSAFLAGLIRGLMLPPRPYRARSTVRAGSRLSVLWVTDEPPDRNQGGGNIRQAMLLDSLHESVDLTLLLVGELRDPQTRRSVCDVLELPQPHARRPRDRAARRMHDLWRTLAVRRPSDVDGAARVRRVLRPTLRRVADNFDVVIVQHLSLAPLLQARRRARWLLEMHNVPSERVKHEIASEAGRRQRWLLAREASNARRYERRTAGCYDGVVFVSARDAEAVTGDHSAEPSGTVTVIPNGVDTTSLTPTPLPSEPNVVFPATLDYRPNVLGAVWFCDEILPRIQSNLPNAQFILVGRRPVPIVRDLGRRSGVEVHADVPVMRPWLAAARVVVVPLWIGTGTRLKALEAMAAGRPVVGTSIGLEGLDLVDGVHARVVDDPIAMANAITELITCDARATELADAGRAHVDANFRWTKLGEQYVNRLATFAG
jgi:polysaccharide biosynthesis protein PslH